MKKISTGVAVVLVIGFTACTNPKNQPQQTQNADTVATKTNHDMQNLVSIVEIPTTDFSRAMTFYQAILNITIETTEMDGVKMGLFPATPDGAFVHLIHGSEYKPSADGTTVYLNGGDDLQKIANKIEAHGGQIVVPKTAIGPEMGYFAVFIDTEGNKLGLHSAN